VLLVDPMRCEEWPPLEPRKQVQVELGCKLARYAVPIARFGLARLGVTSLLCGSGTIFRKLAGMTKAGGRFALGRISEEVAKLPRETRPIVAAHWSRPECYTGISRYFEAIAATVTEMDATEPIRGIPVLVLTPGKSTPLPGERLARIGDNVQQVIAPASAHWIHLDEPQLVIDSIREMVTAASVESERTLV
jgi:pimeloyl-ACP methyl ester carboxylesterase